MPHALWGEDPSPVIEDVAMELDALQGEPPGVIRAGEWKPRSRIIGTPPRQPILQFRCIRHPLSYTERPARAAPRPTVAVFAPRSAPWPGEWLGGTSLGGGAPHGGWIPVSYS